MRQKFGVCFSVSKLQWWSRKGWSWYIKHISFLIFSSLFHIILYAMYVKFCQKISALFVKANSNLNLARSTQNKIWGHDIFFLSTTYGKSTLSQINTRSLPNVFQESFVGRQKMYTGHIVRSRTSIVKLHFVDFHYSANLTWDIRWPECNMFGNCMI